MAKNKNWFYISILVVLLLAFAFYGKTSLSVVLDDSLCYSCGFDWLTSNKWEIQKNSEQINPTITEQGDLMINLAKGQQFLMKSKKSFIDEDVKIVLESTNDLLNIARNTLCSASSTKVNIGSCEIFVSGSTTGSFRTIQNTIIEATNSRLNLNKFVVNVNGEQKCEGTGDKTITINRDISDSVSSQVGCNGQTRVQSIKYSPIFSCQINDGESLAMETFVAGHKTDINSFRYPIKRLCLAHPVIITDENKQGSDTTAEPYDTLIRADSNGKPNSITIPQGQTWSFFYVINYKQAGISVACSKDEAFNVNKQQCTNAKGIITFCSQGEYDAQRGACVVFPEITNVCKQGRLENNVCVYNPPVQAVCKIGDYNDANKKCQFTPQNPPNCEDTDYIYNSNTLMCEALPLTVRPADVSCESLGGTETTINNVKRCSFTPEPFYKCDSGFSAEQIAGKWSCVGTPTTTPILDKTIINVGKQDITVFIAIIGILTIIISILVWRITKTSK